MELAASSYRSCFSVRANKVGAKRICQTQSPEEGAMKGLALIAPTLHIVLATATWDTLFSRR